MPNIKEWKIENTNYTLGVVPKPTSQDEGKIPRVNSQGEVEWVTIPAAESNSFGGGS